MLSIHVKLRSCFSANLTSKCDLCFFSDDSKHSYDVKVHIVPHSTTLGLKSARISTVFDIRSYEPLVVSSFYKQMALIFDTWSKCLCCFSKRKVWCPTCLVVVKKWQHLSTSNLGATTSSRCFESSPSASRNRFGWIQVSGAWSSHEFLAVAILAFEFHFFLAADTLLEQDPSITSFTIADSKKQVALFSQAFR